MPFSKSDGAWLLLRAFGVWLIYTGISALYASLVSRIVLSDMLEMLPSSQSGAVLGSVKVLLTSAFLPLAVGLYCLLGGRKIHDLLMSVPTGSIVSEVDRKYRAAGMSRLEQATFNEWLDRNPSMKNSDLIDQIATFRSS